MSAVSNQFVATEEIKTGKGIGPITTSITLAQAIVGLVFIVLAYFGIVLPVDAYVYSTVIVSAVVGYFTKGRAYVRDTKTIDGVNTPLPSQLPFPKGTGAHRATEANGETL